MGTWNFVYEVTRCILDGTVKKYIYILEETTKFLFTNYSPVTIKFFFSRRKEEGEKVFSSFFFLKNPEVERRYSLNFISP